MEILIISNKIIKGTNFNNRIIYNKQIKDMFKKKNVILYSLVILIINKINV